MTIILKLNIDADFIAQLILIARDAGDAILNIYHAPETINVQIKIDQSPLTAADTISHNIIVQALTNLLPIPIVSEEATLPNFAERKTWREYWLIDPLDGTKEFIARTDEFTVNIALVQNGVPVLGVVHVPVVDETYVGCSMGVGYSKSAESSIGFFSEQKSYAEKYRHGKKIANLKTRNLGRRFAARHNLVVLASARHGSDATAILLQKIAQHWPASIQILNVGSSLKFCWIAEGRADFYPRLAPTCEWDTAAAQAILVAAGGAVVNAKNLAPLMCNASENLVNPSFYAFGDNQFNWALLNI